MIKVSQALLKARAEFKAVHFDKYNSHFKSSYASLGAILDAVTPALTKYGLNLIQTWQDVEGDIVMDTLLLHESGEFLKSTCRIIRNGRKDFEFGSSCTYLRRYAISSMLSIVGEDDDDGETDRKADGSGASTSYQPKKMSEAQVKLLYAQAAKYPDLTNFILTHYKVAQITDITSAQLQEVMTMIDKKNGTGKEAQK